MLFRSEVDVDHQELRTADGKVLKEGDWLSIDGATGEVFAGELETVVPDLTDPWFVDLLSWADSFRRLGVWANVTIAVPRGLLLKVAGWSMVASVFHLEPWYIGSIFMLFLLGASTTKDFSDMEGDAAAGCRTLPIRFGVERAAQMISPFFVVPWLLMPLGEIGRAHV